jgi:Zinc knuckle
LRLTIEQHLKGAALTVDDLESAMTQHYHCVYGGRASNNNSKNDNGTEKEVTLVNIKGNCFRCGKPGHRAKIVIHPSWMVRKESLKERVIIVV